MNHSGNVAAEASFGGRGWGFAPHGAGLERSIVT